MPKELIATGWVQKPCQFMLAMSGAVLCGDCEREFSWWKNSKSHCMFCGYLFHRSRCTRKIQLEGDFFTHRICSKCHYYRNTAEFKLQSGEEFECIGDEGVSSVDISLCESTAELLLHWKTEGTKKTYDLAAVEVRKGFSHVLQHVNTGVSGTYEPLQSFSLFVKDGLGEQCTYHLRASSAFTCQLWVEGLKAAKYVYHKMVEQKEALEFYSQKDIKLSTSWYRKLYLPSAPLALAPEKTPSPQDEDLSEEWVDIVASPYTPRGFSCSSLFSPSSCSLVSPYSYSYTTNSSFQPDLSHSFCSSIVVPRQPLTVHSLNFPTSRTHAASSRSHPTTPALPSRKPASLSPSSTGPSNSQSSAGSSFSPTPMQYLQPQVPF